MPHARISAARRAILVALGLAVAVGAADARPKVMTVDASRAPGIELRNGTPADVNPPAGRTRPLAGAGDVNGDGLADVIVGLETYGPKRSGGAHVLFGRRSSARVDLRRVRRHGFTIVGYAAHRCVTFRGEDGCAPQGQKVGWSVSGAGDVNGDGLDDVIVGAPGTSVRGRAHAGAAYVVFGKKGHRRVKLDRLGRRGFRIDGAVARGSFGASVAGVGDVDADGLADVAVSADGWVRGRPLVYVVLGKRGGRPVDLARLGRAGWGIAGALWADADRRVCCRFEGVNVARAGDQNGDGYADLAIGSPGHSPRGRRQAGSVFVVYGSAGSKTVRLGRLGSRGYRIDGARRRGWAGTEVQPAGDVNGDGVTDLILSAPTAAFVPPRRASAWIVFGGPVRHGLDLRRLGIRGIRIDGPLGEPAPIAGAGDVNADGLDDVILGVRDARPRCRPETGSAYVVFGRRRPGQIRLGALGRRGYRIDGANSIDNPGGAVAGAGDVNGDGRADLLVGTPALSGRVSGLPWTARVVFGRAPRGHRALVERPCIEARVLTRDLDQALDEGRISLRVISRGRYATGVGGETLGRNGAFFEVAHRRIPRPGIYRLELPLRERARERLSRRKKLSLRVSVVQLGSRRYCARGVRVRTCLIGSTAVFAVLRRKPDQRP